MPAIPDYSILDRPEVLQFVFFPRREWTEPPPGAKDYLIPVGAGVNISARLYPAVNDIATILYFHGNGEVACDYDLFAAEYNRLGLSLIVSDYRGYGRSGGVPTITSMLADSLQVFDFFNGNLYRSKGALFLMGRSLGSMPALAVAGQRSDEVAGVIVESGFPAITRILSYLGHEDYDSRFTELGRTSLSFVAAITLPALVIHGDGDMLIPYSEGILLYDTLGSSYKRIVTITGAGHNDIMITGRKAYFQALAEFVNKVRKQSSEVTS